MQDSYDFLNFFHSNLCIVCLLENKRLKHHIVELFIEALDKSWYFTDN